MGLTVGVVLHPERDPAGMVNTIERWATSHNAAVLGLADEVGRIPCKAVAVSPDELVERASLLVSLGGDGTMLRALRLADRSQTPVLGVNLGRLGFLAEVDADDLPNALTAIDEHRYTVEPRLCLRTDLPDGTPVRAFNDVALTRVPGNGLAAVGITVDGCRFVRYIADAVIVSTPTGSTAYSFSAGGPIASPNLEALLVSAAAAHSSFSRALMLSLDEQLVLDVLPGGGRLAIEVDGIGHGMGDHPTKDKRRDAWLRSQGIDVVRISAVEIMRDADEVAQGLCRRLLEKPPQPASPTAPP